MSAFYLLMSQICIWAALILLVMIRVFGLKISSAPSDDGGDNGDKMITTIIGSLVFCLVYIVAPILSSIAFALLSLLTKEH